MPEKLETVPPYNFRLSAGIMREFDGERLYLPLRFEDRVSLVVVWDEGSVDSPEVNAVIGTGSILSDSAEKRACMTVPRMLNLETDLKDFYGTVEDEVLLRLTSSLRGLKVVHTQTVFEALVYAITEQQISLNVAMRIEQRIKERFGAYVDYRGKRYYAFPKPEDLCSPEKLRSCGLSTRKAEYIRDIATAVCEKIDLERFKRYESTEEIIEELCEFRGVGRWTAEMTIMRSMPRYEVFPADDVGIRRCISAYYFDGRRISPQEAESVAERWRAYRGLAAYYLVRASMLGL